MRISDWSSDVCSSDLAGGRGLKANLRATPTAGRISFRKNHVIPAKAGTHLPTVPRPPPVRDGPPLSRGSRRGRSAIGQNACYPTFNPVHFAAQAQVSAAGSEEHTSELQSLMRTSYAVS